jgi:hypothetical protein
MRLSAASIAALLVFGCLSPVLAALQDENLLIQLPGGFKSGYTASNGKEDMAEYVPAGESVDDWSRMVTVQIFHEAKNADPEGFADNLAKGWTSSCPGGTAQKSTAGVENGYPFALWVYACPLNPQTNKPENMFLKVTSGADALYSVQYAYRLELSKELIEPAIDYLKTVMVCDTRQKDRPCPKGM